MAHFYISIHRKGLVAGNESREECGQGDGSRVAEAPGQDLEFLRDTVHEARAVEDARKRGGQADDGAYAQHGHNPAAVDHGSQGRNR